MKSLNISKIVHFVEKVKNSNDLVIDETKVIENKDTKNSKSNVIESIIEDMKDLDDLG